MAAAPSPAEMNRRHREFWDVESQVFERRLADPQLVAAATEDMNSEILRRVPIYSRKTMELAFEDAEKRRAKIRSGDGSKGGRPRRGDALQGLIEEIVSARPAISSASALLGSSVSSSTKASSQILRTIKSGSAMLATPAEAPPFRASKTA